MATTQELIYGALTGEDEGRVCRDIPEAACKEQPRNFLTHVISLGATKTSDGLADAKLVLAWLLGALGAPAFMVGFLVPIREAGALLPQLVIAGGIRSLPRRKWVWAFGSLVQGLCVAGMGVTAFLLDGAMAGWTILALLAIAALARSACSVSYKDVLGKTLAKATRGTATGTAATVAAALVLLFGVLLSVGVLEKSVAVIGGVLFLAGAFWVGAAALFTSLAEEAGATEGGGNALAVARQQASLLVEDPQLVRFIVTRGLLIATALAPPYILALAGRRGEGELGALGLFVVASALAAVLSTYVWGRLSDRSSRKVLILAGIVAALALAATAVLGFLESSLLRSSIVMPMLLFVLMVAYQGVRLGRSIHVVDMATEKTRAAYTALSNTIIGALLVAGGVFGVLAHVAGEAVVLGLFAIMCLAAAFTGRGLEEVQR